MTVALSIRPSGFSLAILAGLRAVASAERQTFKFALATSSMHTVSDPSSRQSKAKRIPPINGPKTSIDYSYVISMLIQDLFHIKHCVSCASQEV